MIRTLLGMVVLGYALGALTPARGEAAATEMASDLNAALADFDRAQELLADQPDVARPLFRAAAQRMESLAARVPNGHLEYNIGNAYLQAGDLGRAILHYRRAERFVPRDPFLTDNLREARSRSLIPIKPGARDRLFAYLFFWHDRTSTRERATVAIVTFLLIWVFLTARLFRPRRALAVLAGGCAVISLVGVASVGMDLWKDHGAPSGVILAMDVPAFKGPGTSYQRQFEQPLQPGVEFTLRERRGPWWRVELADGKTGWIDAAHADLVAWNNLFSVTG